ncbi:MAG TPA: adenylate/guanylate cyclase domain-containing protein [Xanthobacteraceae bacterium]|nr:adenylate/guanylate cyclase domain-containing protein [Xanthobacteraceae bacterium]
MSEDRVERRLAAILAGDIAGYSRLMGVDEEGTLRQLKMHRKELVDPKIIEHRGRIVKTTGDGILVEFVSVVDAVRCAVDIQRGMIDRNVGTTPDKRIQFRIGINVGDIISDDNDIFGDGVNVAARLEALAEPGGICVSRIVYEQVCDKLSFGFEDLGEKSVKNIARPIGVHRVHISEATAPPPLKSPPGTPLEPGTFRRPSIAVLPFANMSGDPDQEYFADGVVEEIITALSHMRWLSVIARNSSFTYKGKNVEVKQVGRDLGVRYVLEGSVRKSGNRLRITGQLIDTSTGAHLWADRFDGSIEDIFDLQDQVTAKVVGAIAPKLEQAEIERARRKPTESLDAYDYYLRGLASLHQWTQASADDALGLFYRSVELDPGFAAAYGMAAWCFVWRKVNGWIGDRDKEILEAERLARRAVELGPDDAVALSGGGYTLVFVVHDLDNGNAFIERALSLNPNLAWALHSSGWTKVFLGDPDTAIKHLTDAIRLSPLDPLTFRAQGGIALAHLLAGRFDEAITWAEAALRERPNYLAAIRELAAACALAGRQAEAEKAMAHLLKIDPGMRLQNVKDWVPLRRTDDLIRLQQGLRTAGLPE